MCRNVGPASIFRTVQWFSWVGSATNRATPSTLLSAGLLATRPHIGHRPHISAIFHLQFSPHSEEGLEQLVELLLVRPPARVLVHLQGGCTCPPVLYWTVLVHLVGGCTCPPVLHCTVLVHRQGGQVQQWTLTGCTVYTFSYCIQHCTVHYILGDVHW